MFQRVRQTLLTHFAAPTYLLRLQRSITLRWVKHFRVGLCAQRARRPWLIRNDRTNLPENRHRPPRWRSSLSRLRFLSLVARKQSRHAASPALRCRAYAASVPCGINTRNPPVTFGGPVCTRPPQTPAPRSTPRSRHGSTTGQNAQYCNAVSYCSGVKKMSGSSTSRQFALSCHLVRGRSGWCAPLKAGPG